MSARVTRVPTALERAGDFSQSLDSGGNPYPYIRDYTTGLPCSASDTRGCFQDGGVLGKIPANRLYWPGPQHAEDLTRRPTAASAAATTTAARCRTSAPRREDLIRVDYQLTDKWRVTGRYMKTKKDETAGLRHDLGRQRLRPAARCRRCSCTRAANWMVSTQGILSNTMSLEASIGSAKNSLDYVLQEDNWYRSATGLTGLPYALPERHPVRLHPAARLPRRPHRQRRAVPDGQRAVHELQRDLRRDREPHEGVGPAHGQGRHLLPAQREAAGGLRELERQHQLHRQRQQPVRHRVRLRERRARASSTPSSRPTPTRSRTGSTRTSSSSCRTTGRSAS